MPPTRAPTRAWDRTRELSAQAGALTTEHTARAETSLAVSQGLLSCSQLLEAPQSPSCIAPHTPSHVTSLTAVLEGLGGRQCLVTRVGLRLQGGEAPAYSSWLWAPLAASLTAGDVGYERARGPHLVPCCGLSFQAWKAHLMGPMGCVMNLRRTHVLHKAPAPPQGEDRLGRIPPLPLSQGSVSQWLSVLVPVP